MKHIKLFEDFEDFGKFPVDPNSPVATKIETDEYPKDSRKWEDIILEILKKDDVETLKRYKSKFPNLFRNTSGGEVAYMVLRLATKLGRPRCLQYLFVPSSEGGWFAGHKGTWVQNWDKIGLAIAWALETYFGSTSTGVQPNKKGAEEVLQILAQGIDSSRVVGNKKGQEMTVYQQAESWLSHSPKLSETGKKEASEKLKELFG